MKSKIILSFVFLVLFVVFSVPFFVSAQPIDHPLIDLPPIDPDDFSEVPPPFYPYPDLDPTHTTPDPLFGQNPQPIPGSNPGTSRIENPLVGNINDIITFVEFVLKNIVLPIGVVVVVFFIIYTGFLFVIAQGNPVKIAEARKMFLWVVIGAAILLGSVVISQAIQATVCKIAPSTWSGCNTQGVSNIIR